MQAKCKRKRLSFHSCSRSCNLAAQRLGSLRHRAPQRGGHFPNPAVANIDELINIDKLHIDRALALAWGQVRRLSAVALQIRGIIAPQLSDFDSSCRRCKRRNAKQIEKETSHTLPRILSLS